MYIIAIFKKFENFCDFSDMPLDEGDAEPVRKKHKHKYGLISIICYVFMYVK